MIPLPYENVSGASSLADCLRPERRRSPPPEGPGAAGHPIRCGTIRRDRSRPRGRSGGEDGSIRPAFTAALAQAFASPSPLYRVETAMPSPSIPSPFSFRTLDLLVPGSSVLALERYGPWLTPAAR